LTAVTLLAAGAGFFPPLLGALVVNVRHVMYSAALVPKFRGQPRWFRIFGPYLLLDQNFALSSVNDDEPDQWRAYYLAAGALAWVSWQIAVAVGILVGPVLPESFDLSFAVPALFIGLLVPTLRTRPATLAAVVGVLVTVAFAGVPNRGGMLIGGVAGVVAGTWSDLRASE
jgi:predicted branched-subunit amino acid permease